MKLYLLISLLILSVSAGAEEPPRAVLENHRERYPEGSDLEWEVDSNSYWEASFEIDGKSFRADYTEDGTWVETERSLDFKELPSKVQIAVNRDLKDVEISEIESVDHYKKGQFFDVEVERDGPNKDYEYDAEGNQLNSLIDHLQTPIGDIASNGKKAEEMGALELVFEFGFNLLTILIFAWVIYYRRHHDHKMLFLLLGFNLFLFPIFLLSSSLSAGFGFTIFALLALVRLRSDTFSKAEVAYLLGAVALTFINAMLPARVEIISSIIVVLTAYLGDHPRIWRDAYQTARLSYRTKDTSLMLNQGELRERIADEFQVEVNEIEIDQVKKNEVRLTVMYRDLPEIRQARNSRRLKKRQSSED